MRFRRKLKRTTRQYITVALICIVVIGSAAIVTSVITIGQLREEYEYLLNEARQEMNNNKKSVYIALSDINTGETLTVDMVEKKTVYSAQPSESYITEDELGKAVRIDITKGTHIVKSMLARNSLTSILREVEYDVIHISPNIEANDHVDVRIVYPNGENYIVMSKKSLKGFQPGLPVCYLWVNEEELLRMSAAIVDAGIYQGSKLFMTKYIEPNIQEASIITYTPNISVLSLIENDPNIVDRYSQLLNIEVRKAIENRLSKSMGLDVSTISWELDDTVSRYMPITPQQHESIEDVSSVGIYKDIRTEKDIDEVEDSLSKEEDNENKVDKTINENDDKSTWFIPELGKIGRDEYEKYYIATEG